MSGSQIKSIRTFLSAFEPAKVLRQDRKGSNEMIELQHVSKTFETVSGSVEAVRDVNLTIQDGDIFGVIGLSGAGKSTLVRCINFLEPPTDGKVLFSGVDLASLSKKQLLETRRKIAMIFQNFNLLAQRSALANVCYPMEITGVPKKKAIEKAKALLERVGLADRHELLPSTAFGRTETARRHCPCTRHRPAGSSLRRGHQRSQTQHEPVRILALLQDINRDLGVTNQS